MAPDTDPTEAAAEAAEPGTEPTADDLAGDDLRKTLERLAHEITVDLAVVESDRQG